MFEKLNIHKASGPYNVHAWLLEKNADILALIVTDIPTQRIRRHGFQVLGNRLTKSNDINKHLMPISLTPILSKLAEEFVVDQHAKPAVLAKVDPRQFGNVPRSSITEALVSMTHTWTNATDGNWVTVRVVLFDFKKAFNLIDHYILIRKLHSYDTSDAVISWITDSLTSRKHQRVKLAQVSFSKRGMLPAGVPQGTNLGPWLFIVMIDEFDIPNTELCKYVDDTTTSETVGRNQSSNIETAVCTLVNRAVTDKFQLN